MKKINIPKPDYLTPKTTKAGAELQKRAVELVQQYQELEVAHQKVLTAPLTEILDTRGIDAQRHNLMCEELQLRYDVRKYFEQVNSERVEEIQVAKASLKETAEKVKADLLSIGYDVNSLRSVEFVHPEIVQGRKRHNLAKRRNTAVNKDNEREITHLEQKIMEIRGITSCHD